jgi:hypothetical protein
MEKVICLDDWTQSNLRGDKKDGVKQVPTRDCGVQIIVGFDQRPSELLIWEKSDIDAILGNSLNRIFWWVWWMA